MSSASGQISDTIEVIAVKVVVVELAEWAANWAGAQGLDTETIFAVRLCVEEAVTNIVLYAYDPGRIPGRVGVNALRTADGAVITIIDYGHPFDAATAPDPGREGEIEEATIGGRGLRLMREFSQGLSYERRGVQNRLTLTFISKKPG